LRSVFLLRSRRILRFHLILSSCRTTGTCDFLICRRCGVFIAAVSETAADARAVVNVNCLSDRERFTSVPAVHDFEGETIETRSSRRAANWMPAIIRR